MIQFKKDVIKSNVSILHALCQFKGINVFLGNRICNSCGILPHTPCFILTFSQFNAILTWVEINLSESHLIGNALISRISLKKENEIKMKSYKGSRYLKGLPANGQRTKTNAKTAKKNKNG